MLSMEAFTKEIQRRRENADHHRFRLFPNCFNGFLGRQRGWHGQGFFFIKSLNWKLFLEGDSLIFSDCRFSFKFELLINFLRCYDFGLKKKKLKGKLKRDKSEVTGPNFLQCPKSFLAQSLREIDIFIFPCFHFSRTVIALRHQTEFGYSIIPFFIVFRTISHRKTEAETYDLIFFSNFDS